MPQVHLSQGTIKYRDSGSGPVIVLVHGFMVDGSLWSEVVPLLSEGHRVVVPDLPLGSHRYAMAADADLSLPGLARLLANFLDALDLHGVTLVGNDTGGAVCQLVATRHPQRLARLVLTNCDAYEHCPPPVLRYLLIAARIPGAVWLLAQSLRLRPARRLPIAYGWTSHRRPSHIIEEAWVAPIRTDRKVRRDVRTLLRSVSNRYTVEAAEQLRGFSGPTLLAWGRPDRLFPAHLAERLATDIPGSRLEWIEGARAFVPLDAAPRLAELVFDFASTDPQPTKGARNDPTVREPRGRTGEPLEAAHSRWSIDGAAARGAQRHAH